MSNAFIPIAGAIVSLAEQDIVEPQANKGWYGMGEGAACTRTIHILPFISLQCYATTPSSFNIP
ncbi:hypothetical protein [Providencia sp. PROV158]|uniref:hypothetical protein n=1 Tax=Providencia sp. PROV158 TaxID=2949868 RepID=UPI00234B961B|nr:hypothetical protein [Providencia sp. PROV158]